MKTDNEGGHKLPVLIDKSMQTTPLPGASLIDSSALEDCCCFEK